MMSQVAQQVHAALSTCPQGLQHHACLKALQRLMKEVSLQCQGMKVCKAHLSRC